LVEGFFGKFNEIEYLEIDYLDINLYYLNFDFLIKIDFFKKLKKLSLIFNKN
jgi:hypothetical protein